MSFPMLKELREPLLREIAQMGGEVRVGPELYQAVARYFPQLTPQDLAETHKSGPNKWKDMVHWAAHAQMCHTHGEELENPVRGVWRITDKGRKRIGFGPAAQTQVPPETLPPPPPPPPRHHEELKRMMVDIGNEMGYHTSTEEVLGPVGHRHDVLWRPGPYKKDPSHVIEVCEGSSLNKDFAALNWVREHLGAHCLLVVTDEGDYEKAKQMFISHPEMAVVMAESMGNLHQLITKEKEFLRWLFEKR